MIEQGVVIAGGLGTRLKEFLPNLPKCLNRVGDFTLIEQTCKVFSESGIKRLHLLLGHLSETVVSEIPALRSKYNLEITFSVEQNLLGTGGSLLSSMHLLDDQFLLTYGDLYLDLDLKDFCIRFENSGYDFAQLIHPTNHMHDSDLIRIDDSGNIIGYSLKPRSKELQVRNRANSGVYAFKKETLLEYSQVGKKVDLDKEILPSLIARKKRGLAIRNLGYARDAGTIDRISRIKGDIGAGLTRTRLRPAVFLDRDGTVNKSRGYISQPEQIELYEDVASAIKQFNEKGFWVIVITNQPVVARGEASIEDLESVHARIDSLLSATDAYIDEYYLCPHHPHKGYAGEITALKVECGCRKPKTGLLEQACKEFPIDRSKSFFFGDSEIDMIAARSFNIKHALITRESTPIGNVNLGSNFKRFTSFADIEILANQNIEFR
jgi:D,D-heptose 1,7-bisphosphate phosphatase